MKKVVNVTIGKTVFVLEEDAHTKLEKYLKSVEKYFAKQDGSAEVVEDIETSFAEKFLAKRKNRDTAITLEQVEEAIAAMGTVKELTDGVEDEIEIERREKGETRLFRDPDNEIIAGVASGIAAYFGIDPVISRLVFFLSIFAGGFGVILYIVLWIIMPEARTKAQQYQMRGEKLTLERIEDSLKKGREKLKKKDFKEARGLLNRFFQGLGRLVMVVLEFFRGLFGVLMSAGGVLGIAVLAFLATMLVTSGPLFVFEGQLDFLRESFEGINLYALLGVTLVILIIPLMFILKGGLSLLRKRNLFAASDVVTMVVLWFVALGVGVAFFADALLKILL